MEIDLRQIDNFLTDDEVAFIEQRIMTGCIPSANWSRDEAGGKVFSGNYYIFNPADPLFGDVMAMLTPKFQKEFHPQLFIQQIHILDAVDPYRIHSDVESGWLFSDHLTTPAWTFIVPLATVDSHTVVFNESSETKDVQGHTEKNLPINSVDDHTYNKYFSHINRGLLSWFSIDQIFKWKKGSMFAAPRFRYHTSDNFPANGVTSKRALIAWTSIPVDPDDTKLSQQATAIKAQQLEYIRINTIS